ncbi:hypothetical protein ZEAMMB73_Zm00001d040899 [Zea mays]|uniref:protein-serine/threonine phosphatase n=1 Tax=Zea mays TaxID=4577 RepID=A0A1D6MTH4_MAIZE|nr:hypothetical protein ZEAMMB73_Zm00001d040899 [Zea mays]
MVVANVGDSRVVLGTAFDDDAINVAQLIVHLKPNLPRNFFRHIWNVLSNDETMQIVTYIEVCMILMVAM